jgi:hypothetical protein
MSTSVPFSCPNCRADLLASADAVVLCSCGQRVKAPGPVLTRAMLGGYSYVSLLLPAFVLAMVAFWVWVLFSRPRNTEVPLPLEPRAAPREEKPKPPHATPADIMRDVLAHRWWKTHPTEGQVESLFIALRRMKHESCLLVGPEGEVSLIEGEEAGIIRRALSGRVPAHAPALYFEKVGGEPGDVTLLEVVKRKLDEAESGW